MDDPDSRSYMNGPDRFQDVPVWFVRSAAASNGITDYALRHDPRYVPLHRGMWIDRLRTQRQITPGWADEVWVEEALRLVMARKSFPGAVGSGPTAARLYGLPLPNTMNARNTVNDRDTMNARDTVSRRDAVHLTTADKSRRSKRDSIVLRRVTALTSREWYGLHLISPEELFVEMAAHLDLPDLIRLGDAAVGHFKGPPLCSLDDLRGVVGQPYLRRRAVIAEAIDLVRERVDSPKETDLRLWLREQGFAEPVVHPAVYCSALGAVLHPDLGYPNHMVALEYQGDHHRTSQQQWATDIDRRSALEAEGWRVIEVTNRSNMRVVAATLARYLSAETRMQRTGIN